MSKYPIKYVGLAPEDPELDARLEAMEEAAERDYDEARVNFRWTREELDTVDRAAFVRGVSFVEYLKQVTYGQAVADLKAAQVPLTAEKATH